MKTCRNCLEEKSKNEFNKMQSSSDGLQWYCRKCSLLLQAIWRDKNPDKLKNITKRRKLKIYGVTILQYDRMFEEQEGRCAICKRENARALAVDHDHKTNKVRMLLCDNCNFGLGHFEDDIERLEKAVMYLRKFSDV